MAERTEVPHMEEPLAELERRLLDEYLRGAGHDPAALRARDDEASRAVLREASTYVAARLAEVESRSYYLRHLHGQE
jgi:hypothetical protein